MNVRDSQRMLTFYVSGFVLSVILTLVAYYFAVDSSLAGITLIVVLVELAILQFFVQLYFFLHFGSEQKPRWRLLTLVFMMCFVLIVVLGSIWIMHNLNYRMMMSPQEIHTYMEDQTNSGF